MDNYHVYYFSRTGNSERIAKKLSDEMSCPLFRISDDVNWQGFGVYFRFQPYVKGKKTLTVICNGNPDNAREIIVVSPIWGSRLTPTVQKFLSAVPKDKVHVVTSSMMDPLRGGEGFNSVTEIIGSKKNEITAIDNLLRQHRIM